jgi:hypothetical protein
LSLRCALFLVARFANCSPFFSCQPDVTTLGQCTEQQFFGQWF